MTGLWKVVMGASAAGIFAVIVFFWTASNQQKDGKKYDKSVIKNEQKFIDTFGTDSFFVAEKKKRAANAKKSIEMDKEVQEIDNELKALNNTNKDVLKDTHKAIKDADAAAQQDVTSLDKQMKARLRGGN